MGPSLPHAPAAMSLRDALLKSGKVSKKDAQKAATAARKERKQKGGHRIEAEVSAEQRARDEARRAEQAEANRERARQLEAERQEHERLMRVRNLITAWGRRPSPRASRRWHFVRSNGRIGFVVVDRTLAAELEYGGAAIVEVPEHPEDVRVVGAEGVKKLAGLAPEVIRFYVGQGGPSDPLVRPPAFDVR